MSSSKILLVDDERAILSALRRVLRTKGFEIYAVESGAEALELLANTKVDLIISDMRMPQMDGATFLKAARESYPSIKRVLLTGYSDMESTTKAINDGGIFGYLSKPWDANQLIQLVESALEARTRDRKQQRLLVGMRKENQKLKHCIEHQTREMATSEQYVNDTYQLLQEQTAAADDVLLNLLDLKQRGHREIGLKVVDIAKQMANQLCLSESETQLLLRCAKLYGIGKIGICDSLLATPQQALSDEQRQAFLNYPLHSANSLITLPNVEQVLPILMYHKAYLDGTGSPSDTSIEIPHLSKILMLAVDYVEECCGLVTGHHERHEDVITHLESHSNRYCDRLITLLSTLTMKVDDVDKDTSIMVPITSLVPSMVLRRDVISPQGTLLLRKDTVMDDNIIQQLHRLQSNLSERLMLNVRFDEANKEEELSKNALQQAG